MRALLLSVAALFAHAGIAVADCTKLNSSDYLENTPWEKVINCVKQTPDAMTKTDGRGYNLLMTAIASDIGPMHLDELIASVPKDLARLQTH